MNNTFEYKLIQQEKDDNGNFILLEVVINDKKITLINICGPNRDTPQFFNFVREKFNHYGNSTILAGEFNLVLNPNKDTSTYVNVNNPRVRDTLIE